MKKSYLKIILLMHFLCFSCFLTAQTQKPTKPAAPKLGEVVVIETNDGNRYKGILMERNDEIVKVHIESVGELKVTKSNIKSITKATEAQLEETSAMKSLEWYDNPNATRYLFAPSAFALKKGEGYYQNILIFYNQVSYGFTNNFTLGFGTAPTFLFNIDASSTPIWITPKYTFGKQDKKSTFALGSINVFLPFGGTTTRGSLGVFYGVGTFGTRDKNISTGLGWGYATGQGASQFAKRPTLNISATYRFNKKSYLVTDNWIPSLGDDLNGLGIISLAYRYATKNVAIDLGLWRLTGEDFGSIRALPMVGISIPFGEKE